MCSISILLTYMFAILHVSYHYTKWTRVWTIRFEPWISSWTWTTLNQMFCPGYVFIFFFSVVRGVDAVTILLLLLVVVVLLLLVVAVVLVVLVVLSSNFCKHIGVWVGVSQNITCLVNIQHQIWNVDRILEFLYVSLFVYYIHSCKKNAFYMWTIHHLYIYYHHCNFVFSHV